MEALGKDDGELVDFEAGQADLSCEQLQSAPRDYGTGAGTSVRHSSTHRTIDAPHTNNAQFALDLTALRDPPSLAFNSSDRKRLEFSG